MSADRTPFARPYSANHMRVKYHRGAAADYLCDGCCGGAAKDWALVHGKSGSEPADFVPLCRRCHSKYDREGIMRGAARRKADPDWQAKRKLLARDDLGRYAKP